MSAARLRAARLRAAILIATVLLTMGTPALPAIAQEADALILVAVPGSAGEQLADRLQARLDALLPGHTVQTRQRPIQSARVALLAGQQYGVALVIWATADAPDTLHHTTTAPVFATAEPITRAWTFDPGEVRQHIAYLDIAVGQAAVLIGACDPALAALELALARAPAGWEGLAEAHYYRGICRSQRGDREAALADFAAAAGQIDDWRYQQALAWGHFDLGETRLALAAMTTAITLAPDRADLYLDRAFFHESREATSLAITDLTAALALEPDNADAYQRRGQAYGRLGDHAAALADYNRLVALRPGDPYALLERAKVYFVMEAYPHALDDLNMALALEPEFPDPFIFQRGLAYLQLGDYDRAVTELQDYTARRPEDAAGWINLGQAHERLGHTFSAVQVYETALAVDPEATHLYSTLARLYYDASAAFEPDSTEAANYLTMAIRVADEALRAYASDATAYLYRALAYLAQGRLENALEDFSAAIRVNPNQAAAYYNRAIVYTRLGDAALDESERRALYRAAIEDYAALLQLDFATYSYLLPYMGYLYVELGQFTEALQHFDAYTASHPGGPPDQALAIYQGRAYLALGRYEEALTAYTAAISGDSPSYTCEAYLAAGLIEGRAFGAYAPAAANLRAYLGRSCPANTLMHTLVRLYLAAWGRPGHQL